MRVTMKHIAREAGMSVVTVSASMACGLLQPALRLFPIGVLSGAIPVTGWKLFDRERQIYVADTPARLDTRQLGVDDKLASMASVEVPRVRVEFTRSGMVLKDAQYDSLSRLPEQDRMELRATGFFTERIAPVEKIVGRTLTMKQPSWDNNLWGYDTIEEPYHPEFAHLYLANSLAFLTQPGQWFIDPAKGRLYLRPPTGADIQHMDVEIPRLATLVAVGDSLAEPVTDLEFRGLRFSHTT